MRGLRNSSFTDCRFAHIGFYALEYRDGCFSNSVVGCEIEDTGSGGIRCGGTDDPTMPSLQNGMNRFENNHISKGGEVFRSGVGILLTHSYETGSSQ